MTVGVMYTPWKKHTSVLHSKCRDVLHLNVVCWTVIRGCQRQLVNMLQCYRLADYDVYIQMYSLAPMQIWVVLCYILESAILKIGLCVGIYSPPVYLRHLNVTEAIYSNWSATHLLSSAATPGTHFLENNKITGVVTILKLCVSKERNL